MNWLVLGVLALAALGNCQETCSSADEDPYFLFGTKTAYTFAHKDISINKIHDVPGCQPIAIWLMNRHGSHNPEVNEIAGLQSLIDLKKNIIENYRNLNYRTQQRFCPADLNLLERWEWDPRQNISFAGDLTSDGYTSTVQLAQAWKRKFPGLLTDNRQYDYVFKYANDQRSTTTFRAFTEGLFRSQASVYDSPKEADEKILRPYKFCPAWTKNVGENEETLAQLRTFEAKQEFKEMISNISLRLGFNYDITRETIQSMYDMCAYNKAWDVANISPWCAAFSKEDLKRLEYSEDLETYYKYGYGTPMNQQIGCTGVKDMMNFFRIHTERGTPQQPRASILLVDAPEILLTVAAVGGRRDGAPLTGDNYRTRTAQARLWTTSTIAPFNANFATVLYKCTPNGNFQVKEQYQVLFLENEKPLQIDGCRVGLCDWSLVNTRLGVIGDNCNMNFCNSAVRFNGFLGFSLFVFIIIKILG